jgi:hypothetical protein
MFMHMEMGRGAVMGMPAEQVAMPASGTGELAIEIKKSKEEQRAPGDPREPGAYFVMQRDSKPGNEQAKEGGKQDVAGARQRRDANGLVPIPVLRPGRDHEREPMRGNGRMKKGDSKSRERDRSKNRFVHEMQNLLIIRTIREHGEKIGLSWRFIRSCEKSERMVICCKKRAFESFNHDALISGGLLYD